MDDVIEKVAKQTRAASEHATGYTPASEIDWDAVAQAALEAIGYDPERDVIVPKEPTDATIKALEEVDMPSCGDVYGDAFVTSSAARRLYKAMIGAA